MSLEELSDQEWIIRGRIRRDGWPRKADRGPSAGAGWNNFPNRRACVAGSHRDSGRAVDATGECWRNVVRLRASTWRRARRPVRPTIRSSGPNLTDSKVCYTSSVPEKSVKCDVCGGSGQCPQCKGTSNGGQCVNCAGTGKCPHCQGTGRRKAHPAK
jgi:hypothetical protein